MAVAGALFGLVVPAAAQNIPALATLPATFATSNPDLVGRRAALMLERTTLHAKVESLNAKCATVVEGSAAEKSCRGDQAQLLSALNSHIQRSKEFNATAQVALVASTNPPVNDSSIVDARNVPTGLPKTVEAEIPDTPAGNRVRKGFEAIMGHDWNVARAWFQDALNHDPGNAGIQRLIDLAEYTLKRAKQPPGRSAADMSAQDRAAMKLLDLQLDARMNADLAKSLNEFNRSNSPKSSDPKSAPPTSTANWKAFFDALFGADGLSREPTSVGGVRD
jgi:hypothetical protein